VRRLPPAGIVVVMAVVAHSGPTLGAQTDATPEAALSITQPLEGGVVSGAIVLQARLSVEAGPVVRLVFTADGQQVCTREAPPFECPWDAGTEGAAHHVRAMALLRSGQRLVANVRTRGARFAQGVEVEVVQVAATVTDKSGRFVKGLPKGAFRIFEDGVRQPVTHFIGQGTARELVVAVDMSGSMEEAMPKCRAAVKQFLAGLRSDDQLTLLAFNDNIFTLAQRETDPGARQRAVDRLAPWGGTALHDVVLRSLDLLDRQRGRRALVLFTDGEDRSSHATVEDVERRVERSAAPIYVIAQGKGMRERELKRVMDRLADVSGGRAFFTDSVNELPGVFAAILEDLENQYLLAYDPANPARDGSWRTIKVEVESAGAPRVRARQGYRATARRN
jgi:Ca-activated chloride channel family protein